MYDAIREHDQCIQLVQIVGEGRFRFIGLSLRIRGGTGLSVRAIAVFEQ
jgi:kynurenine formamidase